jgi:hypothetical protein
MSLFYVHLIHINNKLLLKRSQQENYEFDIIGKLHFLTLLYGKLVLNLCFEKRFTVSDRNDSCVPNMVRESVRR